MERQRQAAAMRSRRDAILLGASAVFTVAGAALGRSVFVELTSPAIAAARPLRPATPEPDPAPAPIDVTPRGLPTRILTEVPMTGESRDEIAAEAARFAPFGAGQIVTVRESWQAPGGGFGTAAIGSIDLADDLFAGDHWSAARRHVELPAMFARSAFVNLTPHDDNGAQLRVLGDYLTTLSALKSGEGREEALAVLNPYTYTTSATGTESDWGRAREAMDEPAGLFAMTATTFLRFPEELVAAVNAMESDGQSPTMMPGVSQGTIVDSPAKTLADRYLRAVADLLTALVPNPGRRGQGYVKTQLDKAFPRFGDNATGVGHSELIGVSGVMLLRRLEVAVGAHGGATGAKHLASRRCRPGLKTPGYPQ